MDAALIVWVLRTEKRAFSALEKCPIGNIYISSCFFVGLLVERGDNQRRDYPIEYDFFEVTVMEATQIVVLKVQQMGPLLLFW